MESDTQRIIRQLGGPTRIQSLLKAQGLHISRQAVAYWKTSGVIGLEFRLPMILLCLDDGINWMGDTHLRTAFSYACKVVENVENAAQAAA